MKRLGVSTWQEMSDLVDGQCELDAWTEPDPFGADEVVAAVHTRGTCLEFPLRVSDLWQTLAELEDEITQELELASEDE